MRIPIRIALVVAAFAAVIVLMSHLSAPADMAAYTSVQSSACSVCMSTPDYAANMRAYEIYANRRLVRLQRFNESGPVGDLLVPDDWMNLRPLEFPSPSECLRHSR